MAGRFTFLGDLELLLGLSSTYVQQGQTMRGKGRLIV
jgi:hypothetical protein